MNKILIVSLVAVLILIGTVLVLGLGVGSYLHSFKFLLNCESDPWCGLGPKAPAAPALITAVQMQENFCAKDSGKIWDDEAHGCVTSLKLVAKVAPTRREKICRDENKGTLYHTDDPRTVVLQSAGNADAFFETVDGAAEYSDDLGIDWALMEGCNSVFLYYNSPAVRRVALFAPQGFDLKSLFKRPFMGAKKVKVTQTASDLTIEVLR